MRTGTAWHTLLGDYPTTHALRSGVVTSSRVSLAFADVPVPNKAFKRVVREVEFDVAEIALMTYLVARSRELSMRLLPVATFSRNPLPHLVCDAGRPVAPQSLADARIGVRAYTTTTAVWIRALLTDLYGVSFAQTSWITIEEGHVAGVPDPPTVRRDPGAHLTAMLRDGQLDAIIIDPVPQEPWCVPVVVDAAAAYRRWQGTHHADTVNHVVAVRQSIADDTVACGELLRMFRESHALGGTAAAACAPAPGGAVHRCNVDVAIAAAASEGLLARELTLGDVF